MKKGFIHIIEIIVIVLIGFLIVYQFSVLPGVHQQYDRTRLELFGKDIVYTLDAQGVNWLDRDAVRKAMESYMNATSVSYSIVLQQVIKTPISVGCVCDDNDFIKTQTALQPLNVNGQHIQFVVSQLTPPTVAGCFGFIPSLPLVYDTILFYDTNLTGDLTCQTYDYTNELRGFLSQGKGIIQIRDLPPEHLQGAEGGLYKTFFGLSYAPGIGRLGGMAEVATPGAVGYEIRQYFHGFPLLLEDFEDKVADNWIPDGSAFGRWRMRSTRTQVYEGQNLGTGNVFNQYTGPLPSNYTLRFDGVMQLRGFSWAFEYHNDNQFIFAAISPLGIFIGDEQSFTDGSNYNSTSTPLSLNTWYQFVVTKQDHDVTISIWNATGLVDLVTARLPLTGTGQTGMLLNGTSGFQFDNFRVSIPDPWTFPAFTEEVNATSGVILQDRSGAAGLVVQDRVSAANNQGRTAWLSDGATYSDQLLRSLVAWSVGDSYDIVHQTVPNPLVINLLKMTQYDFFQPYTVQVSVGYSF